MPSKMHGQEPTPLTPQENSQIVQTVDKLTWEREFVSLLHTLQATEVSLTYGELGFWLVAGL